MIVHQPPTNKLDKLEGPSRVDEILAAIEGLHAHVYTRGSREKGPAPSRGAHPSGLQPDINLIRVRRRSEAWGTWTTNMGQGLAIHGSGGGPVSRGADESLMAGLPWAETNRVST